VFVLETQTAKDFVEWASGNSCISKELLREGDVWRAMDDDHISIKAINPKYLLKHGE
jgi:hypothetical protein